MKRKWLIQAALAAILLARHAEALAPQYTMEVIGPGYYNNIGGTYPSAIDPDSDGVVGWYDNNGYPQALQFTPTFHQFPQEYSKAIDINAGRIVGYVWYPPSRGNYILQAAVWTVGDTPRVLPQPESNGTSTIANCINTPGDIWGEKRTHFSFTDVHPVEWVDGEVLVDLPTLGGNSGVVTTCTDSGDSAGWSTTSQEEEHCTLWQASGEVTDCHPHHGTSSSRARAMNNLGRIAGTAIQYGKSFGFLHPWLQWLMPLQGDDESFTEAINEQGETVGKSCRPLQPCTAVGWESNGQPVALLSRTAQSTGWTFTEATAINNEGEIVVTANQGNIRNSSIVLLTPSHTPVWDWFAWKARIYRWYLQRWVLQYRRSK